MRTKTSSGAAAFYLGIEGGGTRTSVLLEDANGACLQQFSTVPAVLPLMSDQRLLALLREINSRLCIKPHAIGIGLAGVRNAADVDRVRRASLRVWPRIPCLATNDLETALATEPRSGERTTRILVLSGTGSCCYGKNSNGKTVKIGGRGHIIGDRGSACDIGLKALRKVVADLDHRGRMSALGSALLASLMFNEVEQLIPWSVTASKTEIAQLSIPVFRLAGQGNAMARTLLTDAAKMLSDDAIACAEKLGTSDSELEFVFNGAVLLKNPTFQKQVTRLIRVRYPRAKMSPLTEPSVKGAIHLARTLVQFDSHDSTAQLASALVTPTLPTPVADLAVLKESPTEKRNPNSMRLSELSPLEGVDLMLKEDEVILPAIAKERNAIAQIATKVGYALKQEGKLFYIGAGSSGRIGVLDASEIPPTFSASPDQVQGIIAGGRRALWSAVEGAEDDLSGGINAIAERGVQQKDVVIGIASSGRTPFVWGAIHEANRRGAFTVLLCFNPSIKSAIRKIKDKLWKPSATVAIDVGPEILTGSTRLKSGTATKMVLNMISTLSMVQCDKVISNLMVDLNPSNAKLRDRAVRMLMQLTDYRYDQVASALKETGWVIKEAYRKLQQSSTGTTPP